MRIRLADMWKVIGLKPPKVGELPDPVLIDDREKVNPSIAKNVLAWLKQTAPEFQDKPPTPITVQLYGSPVHRRRVKGKAKVFYRVGRGTKEESHWRHHTIEFCLKGKFGIVARYRYLAASNDDDMVIVGPRLRIVQDQRIVLAA